MNKLLMLTLLLICLSGCGAYNTTVSTTSTTVIPSGKNLIADDALDAVLESISTFYEPARQRSFDIRELPAIIDNQVAVVLDVYGEVSNGRYPLETFAISSSLDSIYYFSSVENQFVKIEGTPHFVYSDSTDKKYRAETGGMTNTYVSGNFVPDIIRVLELSDGAIKWSADGTSNTRFWWSPDSSYLAVQGSGRKWTEVLILDTRSWSEVFHTRAEDLFDVLGVPLSDNPDGVSSFLFNAWDGEHSFNVDFEIDLTEGTRAVGSFIYSLDTNLYINTTVEEISVG